MTAEDRIAYSRVTLMSNPERRLYLKEGIERIRKFLSESEVDPNEPNFDEGIVAVTANERIKLFNEDNKEPKTDRESQLIVQVPNQDMLNGKKAGITSLNICAICLTATILKCGACSTTSYCGKDHQIMDWPRHRIECAYLKSAILPLVQFLATDKRYCSAGCTKTQLNLWSACVGGNFSKVWRLENFVNQEETGIIEDKSNSLDSVVKSSSQIPSGKVLVVAVSLVPKSSKDVTYDHRMLLMFIKKSWFLLHSYRKAETKIEFPLTMIRIEISSFVQSIIKFANCTSWNEAKRLYYYITGVLRDDLGDNLKISPCVVVISEEVSEVNLQNNFFLFLSQAKMSK